MAKVNRPSFEIAGETIAAGERGVVEMTVPDLYIHTNLTIPVHVVHGKKDGPVLFISGAVHGDEIMGVEIIRRVLSLKRLRFLRGTLLAVPIVNVFGFLNHSRYLPDRRDLNRSFPGYEKGSIAGRLANNFITEIVSRSTHGVDLHTAAVNRENLPQVRGAFADRAVLDMAKAFGLPVIVNSDEIEGSLRHAASSLDVKVIVYEAGEALRFDEVAIRGGVNGVIRVMEHLGMLVKRKRKGLRLPTLTKNSRWVRAPQSGIHRSLVALGSWVKVNDPLGYIADPLGGNEQPVLATSNGVVIGRSNIPLVTEGEALFHIASFNGSGDKVVEQLDKVEAVLDGVKDVADEPPIV